MRKVLQAIAVIAVCVLIAEARRRGGGGSSGSSNRGSGSRPRPSSSSSSSSRDRDRPSASAPPAPGWNVGSGNRAPGSGSPPAPGWNVGSGQQAPKAPTNGLSNPPTNPHWTGGQSGGLPQNNPSRGVNPPAPGWNVGAPSHPNPGVGIGGSNYQPRPGGYPSSGYNPGSGMGGGGAYGYGGGYGQQQHYPTYGSPPAGWGGNSGFGFGNRMGTGGYGSTGMGSGFGGNSKTGLLAAAAAGAVSVAGVYYLSQAMSPGRSQYYGSSSYGSNHYDPRYTGNNNNQNNNGNNNSPAAPQMLCVGGSNNCAYQPTAVQCVNATYNGTDGQQHWQIACGDPKMDRGLCFNNVTLTCDPVSLVNATANGTAWNSATPPPPPACKLQYSIDRVKDSNCTAALTFPEKFVGEKGKEESGSGLKYLGFLIPIGLVVAVGIFCITRRRSDHSASKDDRPATAPPFGPDVRAPLYQDPSPYPTSYQNQSPYPFGNQSQPPYPVGNQFQPPYPVGTSSQPPYPMNPY